MDKGRKRDSRGRDSRRDGVQTSSSAADRASRLRMDSYSGRNRGRPSPPRRKEIDNVMKKARRDGSDKSQYWNQKLLEVEEKDPNRWRHSGYKELYGEKSSSASLSRSRSRSRSRSHSRSPINKRINSKPVRARTPPNTSLRRKSRSRSRSPVRNKNSRNRKPNSPQKAANRRSRSVSGSSESVSSCSDESCSVCSPKHGRKRAPARSRSRSFSVPRSRPVPKPAATKPAGPGAKTSTAVIGRKPPPKPARPVIRNEKSSPPRDPRPSAVATTVRKEAPPEKAKRGMLAQVKVEGQKRPPPPESDSDDSSSSSDASGTGAPKMTLSERFGKMAQWSVDRRDIDYVKNMKITKESDSSHFKVVIDGPDEDDFYRGAPDFADRRFGAGYYPETMHSAPVGLSSWDDVRVRYKYYKARGYLRDLTLEDYMKWEEWWYKYQDWLEAERYYEWAIQKRRRYRSKHSPIN